MKNFKDDTFLARWLNDELTDDELMIFKTSEEYKDYKKIADNSARFEIPAFDKDKVKAKIKASLDSKNAVKPTKVRKLYYSIASAAAVLLISIMGINYFGSTSGVVTYASTQSEKMKFDLPDGSTVELNGLSSITFNKKQWENNNRTLSLKGEGYFKVKKGSKFTVNGKQGSVSVLGTEFNIKNLNTFFEVECYEGKVLVEKEKTKTILTLGKGIRFDDTKSENFKINHNKPHWKSNAYLYNNTPLKVVLMDLKNVYNVNLISNNIDSQQKFTGTLITYDMSKALNTICKPLNLKHTITGTTVTIKNN